MRSLKLQLLQVLDTAHATLLGRAQLTSPGPVKSPEPEGEANQTLDLSQRSKGGKGSRAEGGGLFLFTLGVEPRGGN